MAKRAAIYCRISSNPDGTGTGVDRQEADCRAVCEREGWTVVDAYVDDDQSAYSGKERPEWTRMLRDAGDGRIDVVVAWHDDRLWRNVTEQQTVFGLLAGYGVGEVRAGQRTYDTSSADDNVLSGIQALFAQKESADKSRRTLRARDELAAKGIPHVGGRRPYGYERDMVTIRPEEADTIRRMADAYLAGATTWEIARGLEDRGVPTASGRSRWSAATVRSILGGARIAGLRVHRGEVVGEGTWPAIIDREAHERIRARMGDPRRTTRRSSRSRLLSGLVTCGRCGHVMSAVNERTIRTGERAGRVVSAGYQCTASPATEACGRRAIRAEGLEEYVSGFVLHTLESPAAASAARTRSAADEQGLAHLTATLRELQGRLDELADAFADGHIEASQLTSGTERIRARMEEVRRRIRRIDRAAVLLDLPADTSAIVGVWEEKGTAWRHRVVRALVERIVIGPGVPGTTGFQPDRVEVVWR